MYYICEIYPLKQSFVIFEQYLDTIVSEFSSHELGLLIKSFVSEQELPECYVELKPRC